MVTFGTNTGPIVPRPTTPKPTPRFDLNPAPVFETVDDIPNPNTYRPPIPHQYRSKFFSYVPSPNLIFGTPLDIKYTPSLSKYDIFKRKQAKSLGFDYRGPQFFEKQAYEYEYEKKYKLKHAQKEFNQQIIHYQQELPQQQLQQQYQIVHHQNQQPQHEPAQSKQGNVEYNQAKVVPEFGIIYSSGVKYYVPQLVYYNNNINENSVYDDHDVKYYRQ